MSDEPQRHDVVKFSPTIATIIAGYALGFMVGFLIMICLILLGVV